MTNKPLDFLTRLAFLKPVIWREVERSLPGKISHPHYRMVQDYPRRQGKYFRPAIFLMALELFGANWQNFIELAAVLQLCEDWLLVHDDVEDKSHERRGRPSLNALYGDELAINAGDALHATMWQALYRYLEQDQVKNKTVIFNQVAQTLKTTLEGQFEELWWARRNKLNLAYKDYYQMAIKKTCHYTVVGPVRLAGISAGLSDNKIAEIDAWAIPFGQSFQIWDDVLDLETDITEKKRTLPLVHLLNNCSSKERLKIGFVYRKKSGNIVKQDVDNICFLLKKYQSAEYAKAEAQKFSRIALAEFRHFSASFPGSPAKSQIQEAIKFVVTRNN